MGWGIFNVVEGIVSHHLLGLHHVNETVPQAQWLLWDLAFLVWGAAMIVGGAYLVRRGQRETVAATRAGRGDYARRPL
jgi:uncharacterized membrane protein